MAGCCFCTKSQCYQDKDQIEYYGGNGNRVSQDFAPHARLNGSDDGSSYANTMGVQRSSGDDRLIR